MDEFACEAHQAPEPGPIANKIEVLVPACHGHIGGSVREQNGPLGCSSIRMKISAFVSFLAVAAPPILQAQPQLENPSFESWDNAGQATQEPQQWSSLKTSDGGALINSLVPQLCWRSDDARTGQHSVNLRTVSSVVGAANGLLTNGRVHAELDVADSYMYTVQDNEQWRTAMTSRPDSIVGWFKAAPQSGDRANVGALLHVDEGRLPAFGTEGNYVAGASWKAPFGNVSEWTRFSAPFQYLNDWQPEWILLILTAGDSAGSQVGTQAWFEDLALIYNVQCAPDAQSVAPGGSFSVDYSTGGTPNSAVTFSVELSDANGDFSAPVVIGEIISAGSSGMIPCILPVQTAPGTGYRIRVVSDSPFYAPVGCDLAVEVNTGVDHERLSGTIISTRDGELVITSPHAAAFECFSADGRLLMSGRLGAGMNSIGMNGRTGMIIVRLFDGQRIDDRLVWLER